MSSKKTITRMQAVVILIVVIAAGLSIGAWSMLQQSTGQKPSASQSTSMPLTKLKIGINGPANALYAQYVLAQERGYWAKQNLDVELVYFSGGSGDAVKALATGALQITSLDLTTLGLSIQQGVPIIAVAMVGGQEWSVLVSANSTMKSLNDLKGKQIGLSQPGSASNIWFNILARAEKWTIGTDIKPQFLGNIDTMIAGLLSGQVAAILLQAGQTAILLDKKQVKQLAISSDFGGYYPNEVLTVTTDLIKTNPDLIQQVVNALFDINRAIIKDNTILLNFLVSKYGFSKQGAEYFITLHKLTTDGTFDKAGITWIPNEMISAGIVQKLPPIEEWYTTQFVPSK